MPRDDRAPIRTFRERLRSRKTISPFEGSDDLWSYRKAAAVLASFRSAALHPIGKVASSSKAKAELLADCDVASSLSDSLLGDSVTWTLRTPVRQAALRRLVAEGEISEALHVNPEREKNVTQLLLETCLNRTSITMPSGNSLEECRALLKVTEWLRDIPELTTFLPPIDFVRNMIAREQLLEPFRVLAGANFAGRKSELAQLADYVGVHQATTFGESLSRLVEHVLSISERPPLLINGPGGCGKSTLISRFILDHAEIAESARFPFAYLDFDRPGLLAEEPITLLTEVMRQLSIQFPQMSDAYRRTADAWSARLAADSSESDSPMPIERKFLHLHKRTDFLIEFSNFVDDMKREDQPLLLVLDTFEEVQFRSSVFVEELLDFLNELQSHVPRLRTVLSGRAAIKNSKYKLRLVGIGNFDLDSAKAFLQHRGVTDPEIAATIFQQVGGSPLVLRLAADLAKIENISQRGFGDIRTGWLSLFRDKSIEVVLYKRILSHIYDTRVRELAYPGLVLRILTPEILLHVLAPACNVNISSFGDATLLIQTMREQLSTILVPIEGDENRLVHRPDMRGILLQDVRRRAEKKEGDCDKRLKAINELAVRFYSGFDDAANRAEEIYHRLALGIDRPVLDSRWQDDLKPHLGSSILELPAKSQGYLAAKLNLELEPEVWSQADDEDWVIYAARVGTEMVLLGKPVEAVKLLMQRRLVWVDASYRSVLHEMAQTITDHYASEYERISKAQEPGTARTQWMTNVVQALINIFGPFPVAKSYVIQQFEKNSVGSRLVGLALAQADPDPSFMDLAIDAIENSLSAFEQYQGLQLAMLLLKRSSADQRKALRIALLSTSGKTITEADPSRFLMKTRLLKLLGPDGSPLTKKK